MSRPSLASAARSRARRPGLGAALTARATQLPDRGELGERAGELAFGDRDLFLRRLVLHRFLGALLGFERFRFVEVAGANGGVRQHGHDVGLYFEEAAL